METTPQTRVVAEPLELELLVDDEELGELEEHSFLWRMVVDGCLLTNEASTRLAF